MPSNLKPLPITVLSEYRMNTEISDKKIEVILLIQDDTRKRKNRFLDSVKKHRFRLPADYRFDREELHER